MRGGILSVPIDSVRAVPSSLHEALIEMVRQRPEVVSVMLADGLQLEVPSHDKASVLSADSSSLTAIEYRADAVVVLSQAKANVLAVVVEVQLRRDRGRGRSISPPCVAGTSARRSCSSSASTQRLLRGALLRSRWVPVRW